jgi:hypothetical protein
MQNPAAKPDGGTRRQNPAAKPGGGTRKAVTAKGHFCKAIFMNSYLKQDAGNGKGTVETGARPGNGANPKRRIVCLVTALFLTGFVPDVHATVDYTLITYRMDSIVGYGGYTDAYYLRPDVSMKLMGAAAPFWENLLSIEEDNPYAIRSIDYEDMLIFRLKRSTLTEFDKNELIATALLNGCDRVAIQPAGKKVTVYTLKDIDYPYFVPAFFDLDGDMFYLDSRPDEHFRHTAAKLIRLMWNMPEFSLHDDEAPGPGSEAEAAESGEADTSGQRPAGRQDVFLFAASVTLNVCLGILSAVLLLMRVFKKDKKVSLQ